jgi:hypothetical protein
MKYSSEKWQSSENVKISKYQAQGEAKSGKCSIEDINEDK